MSMRSRIAKGAAVVALVALIAVPISAWAVPGNGGGKAHKANPSKNTSVATKQNARKAAQAAAKKTALMARIDKVLGNRSRAFDNAASRISARIDTVTSLTATVSAAGGDVGAVLTQLQHARNAVADARSAEAEAVRLFKLVPDAADRKAAFAAAKAQAHTARVTLSEARSLLRGAVLALKAVVVPLETVTP